MVDFKRRDFMFSLPLIMGMQIPLSGCLPLFVLRLGLGRGAAASLGRLARSGGAGAALSFGRGISAASRMTTMSTRSYPRTQIVDRRGNVVAEAIADGQAVNFKVDGATIFQSVETSFGFRHYDMHGPVGKTYRQPKGVNRHVTQGDDLICTDHVDHVRRVIVHKDGSGKIIGSSRLKLRDTEMDLSVDQETVDSIDSYVKFLGLDCPDSKAAYQELQEAKEKCSYGDQNACDGVSTLSSIYRDARNICRGHY